MSKVWTVFQIEAEIVHFSLVISWSKRVETLILSLDFKNCPEYCFQKALKMRKTLITAFFCLSTSVIACSAYFVNKKAHSAVNKPNIVTIMADDLCVGMLDIAIQQGFMPNLKKYIINKGTSFNNSFVSNSLCCPSRSTFLTGQYTHNHQVSRLA
ncbi:MAG: sulfatase-like hydrolase/transferase [Thermosynechococcaceae cyanobacterium]